MNKAGKCLTNILKLIVCSCHVTYAFQSESTLYSCLNVKELLARSRYDIWSLSDCNWTRTQNHLVRERTLNHLASLAKWLKVRLQTNWFWVRVQLQSLILKLIFVQNERQKERALIHLSNNPENCRNFQRLYPWGKPTIVPFLEPPAEGRL